MAAGLAGISVSQARLRAFLFIVAGLLLAACAKAPAPTRAQLLQLLPASPTALPGPPARSTQVTRTTGVPPATTPAASVPLTPSFVPTTATTATPTSIPQPTLRRLTGGGCCTQPFWSADGRRVLFIDRPTSRQVGVYGVDVVQPGPPALISEQIYPMSGDGQFYVYPDGSVTVIQRIETGEQTVIPNGGRPVSVSPDGRRVLWQVTDSQGDFDRRRSEVWIADVDGSHPRVVARSIGLGDSQWLDSQRILVVGVPLDDSPFVAVGALSLDGQADQWIELAQVSRPSGASVSPDGNWLVYYLTFQADAAHDGLWVVPTDGSAPPLKLDFFGSYRWRNDAHLLYVPLEPGVESHTLWEYDVVANASRRLTDPAFTPFKIANNDWSVSPNGRYIVFVSAADHSLWLLDLEP